MASIDWAKTTARRDKNHLSFAIWCAYIRDFTVVIFILEFPTAIQSFYNMSSYSGMDKKSETWLSAKNFILPGMGIEYSNQIRSVWLYNTLRPRQNGQHFADDIFKCIFFFENVWILIKILLKFVPKVRINNIPALVQIMAWCRPGDKPLSEPMVVSLLTHLYASLDLNEITIHVLTSIL